MGTKVKASPNGWGKAKTWVVGLTGVLVGVPALINAGVDIYKAVLKIPRTESERANAELFKKYFNKVPIVTLPIPVKQTTGTTEVKFSVYEEGDVYVEYGSLTQWFPFPRSADPTHAAFSIVPPASAQTTGEAWGIGKYQQSERIEGNTLVRERVYANGVVERQRIDLRTGAVLDKTVSESVPRNPGQSRDLAPFGVIDLGAPKDLPASQGPLSTVCATSLGTCAMPYRVSKGTTCFCLNTSGTIPGVSQ